MPFCRPMAQLALICLVTAGCERAHKFPPAPPQGKQSLLPTKPEEVKQPGVSPDYGWLGVSPRPDIPIRFISQAADPKEWDELPEFWNEFIGTAEIYKAALGLSPLEATITFRLQNASTAVGLGFALSPLEVASTLRLQVSEPVIKIKVPRGLPDPQGLIPITNPPTYGKWLLGKKLFFEEKLLVLSTTLARSCADCHDPKRGFTLHAPKQSDSQRNVPSLINSVYNRHQFWDGRATALEQVLLRQLDDEQLLLKDPPPAKSPGHLHVWPGMIAKLGRADYFQAFERVFGTRPTADSVAKALATYMRTILSGDSLYDRALFHKGGREQFLAKDFEDSVPHKRLSKATADSLVRGYNLFMGPAGRCVKCHNGPLFTDQGFHNVGIGDSGDRVFPGLGEETGRFAAMPYGLKHKSQIGAYKTPTLRNLSVTNPYMHDGSLATLKDVVGYYSDGIKDAPVEYLDPELTWLRDGVLQPHRLGLTGGEVEDLVLFLRSLQGGEVPPIISEPAQKS
jgi:cytochrome c peroxidase